MQASFNYAMHVVMGFHHVFFLLLFLFFFFFFFSFCCFFLLLLLFSIKLLRLCKFSRWFSCFENKICVRSIPRILSCIFYYNLSWLPIVLKFIFNFAKIVSFNLNHLYLFLKISSYLKLFPPNYFSFSTYLFNLPKMDFVFCKIRT